MTHDFGQLTDVCRAMPSWCVRGLEVTLPVVNDVLPPARQVTVRASNAPSAKAYNVAKMLAAIQRQTARVPVSSLERQMNQNVVQLFFRRIVPPREVRLGLLIRNRKQDLRRTFSEKSFRLRRQFSGKRTSVTHWTPQPGQAEMSS